MENLDQLLTRATAVGSNIVPGVVAVALDKDGVLC
jgi:hypothetical protein